MAKDRACRGAISTSDFQRDSDRMRRAFRAETRRLAIEVWLAAAALIVATVALTILVLWLTGHLR